MEAKIMEKEEVIQEVVKFYKSLPELKDLSEEGLTKSVSSFIHALDVLDLKVVPINAEKPILSSTNEDELQTTILAWISNEPNTHCNSCGAVVENTPIELDDIHVESIIQSLEQRGWMLIPPQ